MSEVPVIDLEVVAEIRGVDSEDGDVYDELVAIYRRDAPDRIARMQATSVAETLAREAHRLRGSAGTMGFKALAAACTRLEDACESACTDTQALVDAVVAAHEDVLKALESL